MSASATQTELDAVRSMILTITQRGMERMTSSEQEAYFLRLETLHNREAVLMQRLAAEQGTTRSAVVRINRPR